MPPLRIAIVGSGFAGSILARGLQLQGHRVTLLDRQRHPRFALGESSTPLAALSLERLARIPGLDDLRDLAAHGRWRRNRPELVCGLKRGFTFYRHRPGRAYENGPSNEARLLVAASPDAEIADVHWLRADVDGFLFRRAEEAGVACLEEAEVADLERGVGPDGAEAGWRLGGFRRGEPFAVEADLLFDASGPGGFLARHLGLGREEVPDLRTALVYGHFTGVPTLAEAAPNTPLPPGPYPDDQAAVHHLIDEGWMYVLPFDDGRVSAGFVLAEGSWVDRIEALRRPGEVAEGATGDSPDRIWSDLLARHPTIGRMFEGATTVRPIAAIPRLQHRLAVASGEDWALLPHAFCFYSPMFSTGIAWSLLAVERLLQVAGGSASRAARAGGLARYGRLLREEALHLERLVAGAYRAALWDFDLFVAWTDLYFAAASSNELRQRLCSEGGSAWAWWGFLGSTNARIRADFEECYAALRGLQASAGHPNGGPGAEGKRRFLDEIARRIEPYNVAGLADPARNRTYPVDLEPLLRHPGRLGLTASELAARLHRLRGEP